MKTCTKCKIKQDESNFYSDKRRPDGLRCWCKTCQKIDGQKREPNYNETRRKYRLEHKKEFRENKKIYYQNNKEKILADNAKWRQTLNGRFISYITTAKKRNIEWDLTKDEFESYWGKDCYYCGEKINGIGIDRIDSNVGYIKKNIVPCCYQCNIIKMDYTYDEFISKIKKIYNHLNLN
jgi:hypothetical protein